MRETFGLCAAAVAVEDLAHQQYAKLDTPAAAVAGLALCGCRRLVVGHPARPLRRAAIAPVEAVRFLQLAPTNVSSLTVHASVEAAAWRNIVRALDRNRCHELMQHLHLGVPRCEHREGPHNVEEEFQIDSIDAARLLVATGDLSHLRSFRCTGEGADILLGTVGDSLRWLGVADCAGTGDFALWPLLRRVGPMAALRNVTVIDLSRLHLMRVDTDFGTDCDSLRAVQLPSTVTSIGDRFLSGCLSFTGVLDLSHVTQLRRVGFDFAIKSRIAGVQLPPNVTSLGDNFFALCTASASVLDLSRLTQLQEIGSGFAQYSSVPAVRLPASVTCIGDSFLEGCPSLIGAVDLSHVSALRRIGERFAMQSTIPDVRLPPSVEFIGGQCFVGCLSWTTALDLSHLTLLHAVRDSFAAGSSIPAVRLPATVRSIADAYLSECTSADAVDLSYATALRSIGDDFARSSSVSRVQLPSGVESIGDGFLQLCFSFTAVLDLSHVVQLRSIGGSFGRFSTIPDARLPSTVASLGERCFESCTRMPEHCRAALLQRHNCAVMRAVMDQ
jgi:hypothetical protein